MSTSSWSVPVSRASMPATTCSAACPARATRSSRAATRWAGPGTCSAIRASGRIRTCTRLGFPFQPWVGDKAIADGGSIRDYIRTTAQEYGIDRHIRYGHKVLRADWSSADAIWTLAIERDGAPLTLTCRFLYLCAGYYDYERGHMPDYVGIDSFQGRVVHPQFWPEDLDCRGQKIVVIGSGATAVTLVPALAERGAEVVMLQRSPSYVVARPAKDKLAATLQRLLPPKWAYGLIRWRNVLVSLYFYNYARKNPDKVKTRILAMARQSLGPSYDIRTHFTPRYNPWDQRMCLVPDADLFKAVTREAAEIVTDEIETFTPHGAAPQVRPRVAGRCRRFGDGPQDEARRGHHALHRRSVRRSVRRRRATRARCSPTCRISPTRSAYTNASWTLKCDLTSAWVCRVIAHMDRGGYASCVPEHDASVGPATADHLLVWLREALDRRLPQAGGPQSPGGSTRITCWTRWR